MTYFLAADVETTGMEEGAEVVELGICGFDSDLPETMIEPHRDFNLWGTALTIPPEVRAIHHITNDVVNGLPRFADYADIFLPRKFPPYTEGQSRAIVSHNWDFDGRWLADCIPPGVDIICTLKCALRLWPEAPSHSNGALRYHLQDTGEWPAHFQPWLAQPAHRAGPDAYVTLHLLMAMLTKANVQQLVQWSAEPKQLVKMPLGKHRGARFDALPLDYLQWAARSDMGVDIKAACRQELTRRADARAPKPPGVTSP